MSAIGEPINFFSNFLKQKVSKVLKMYGIILTTELTENYDETDMFCPTLEESFAYAKFGAIVSAFRITEWVGCVNLVKFDVDTKNNVTNSELVYSFVLH